MRFVELTLAPSVRAIACLVAAAAAITGTAANAAPAPATSASAAPAPATSATAVSGTALSGSAVSAASAPEVIADASSIETLRACVAKLPRSARGLDALVAECPDLKRALAALGYSKTMSSGWESGLTPAQLEDLAALASRYRVGPPSAVPQVSALRGIVAALAKERATAAKSWWEVFRDWVKSLFAGRDEHARSWIERWMDKLSGAAGVLTIVTYMLVALVIGVALGYVVIELRSSGVFARAARSGKTASGVRLGDAEPVEEELARAPIFDQPALLLALLVRRLKRAGRLSAERHLTHRELARAATLDDPDQRNRLGRLTQVAEELLYGARPPSPELVHRAVDEGRELLRALDSPRNTPP